ncbi:S8 family serine peptidase, partial [Butyrivibrio sp. MC2021]|uniref:S8 family serine peptidase n=1 Tax=Butyrivibrio sp. MC2021 TaxID=1408306 RepID=UPI00056AD799
MKKKMCPEKTLAVILSASLALSPAITASAASGDGAEELLSEELTEDLSEEVELEEVPAYEKVDPAEVGLEKTADLLNGEAAADVEAAKQDPDEQTRVIIVMEGDSVLDAGFDTAELTEAEAVTLSENIVSEQEATVEKIEEEALEGEELDVNFNLSIVTNAVSADVAYKDIEKIKLVDGVAAVYVAQEYEPQVTADPMTITSGDMVGSYSTWATGYTGAGTRIAVIDTGIDSDHPSFDGAAFDAHLAETAEKAGKTVEDYNLLTAEEIETVLPSLNASKDSEGLTGEQLFVNDKVAFAYNYVDKNLDITHDNDEEGDHGTHVSGIATANAYVPNAAAETGFSQQAVGVVGIAPDAQLITMKVFGTNGGAYTDDYMAAIEDALRLKADVVNLSLGSAVAGYSADSETYVNDIFEKLEGTSTVVSISAGNSGRWADDSQLGVNLSKDVNQDTVGSPGSYYNALTVASAVNSGMTANYFATADGAKIFYADGNDTLAPKFKTLDTSADQNGTEYPFVYLEAKGEKTDYEGVDVEGKIVFVSRGTITFGEKQMNAEAAGAIGVVVYNNQAGTINMTLQGSTAVIPAVSITQAEGLAVAEQGEKVADGVYTGVISVAGNVGTNYNAADGYTMSTFSSYGVPATLDLKPEITAPGGNIYSTIDNGEYGLMSGTSMAAPSVSGQSALVEQYIRENGLAEKTGLSVRTLAQSLLMATAVPLYEDNDPSGLEYSPRSQGAGLANVYNAVTSPVYALVGDKEGNDGKVKVVLGDDPSKSGEYNFSFDLYNLTEEPQYYVLDSTVLTEQIYAYQNLRYFAGSSHKLNPAVSLTADNTVLVYDLNGDGKVNKKDRLTFLQAVNGSVEVPGLVAFQDEFDFNNDGAVNTKDVFLFGKQFLKGGEKVADVNLRAVEVKDAAKVNVSINLSAADKKYLAQFENGMYVDGFIYAKGAVDLSVPFLAFYGNWGDSSMFEDYDFYQGRFDDEYSKNSYLYTGLEETNFISFFPYGEMDEDNEYYLLPNLVADDAEYIPDRTALSGTNGTVLGGFYYTLIRNANRVVAEIKDKKTGEVYYSHEELENYAAFTYQGAWQNSLQTQELLWGATDAEGNVLPDDTEVEVKLTAVPSYYDDVEDINTLTGKGLSISYSLAVDNTEPEIVDAVLNEDGTADLTVQDNRYTAAILTLDASGYVDGRYAVDQTVKGEEKVVTVKVPEGSSSFYIELYDYALNSSLYTFTLPEKEEPVEEPETTKYPTSLTTDVEELDLEVGDRALIKTTVGPENLEEGYDGVEFMSSNELVATVSSNGTVTALKEGRCTILVSTKATDENGKNLTATVWITVRDYGGEDGEDSVVDDTLDSSEDAALEEIGVAEEIGGSN